MREGRTDRKPEGSRCGARPMPIHQVPSLFRGSAILTSVASARRELSE